MTISLKVLLRRIAALTVTFGLLVACTHGAEPSQANEQEVHVSAHAPIFLWKFKRTEVEAPLYLYGTAHMNDATSGRLDAALLQALQESQSLVLEVSPEDEQESQFRQKLLDTGLLPPGPDLMQVLSAETAKELQKFFKEFKVPSREQRALLRMRPWLASLSVLYSSLREAGASREFGSEEQLVSLARAQGKPILGLEKADFQLELMASGSSDEQEYHLRQSLQEVRAFLGKEEASSEVHELFDAYRRGDMSQLDLYANKLALDPESRSFYERFLVQRNKLMLEKILTFKSDSAPLFVAVGALHLAGPEGLLDSLKNKGFQLERVAPLGRVQELYLPID